MSEIKTASVDLIVTSPPYWDLKDYGDPNQLGLGLTYPQFMVILQDHLMDCLRVLKYDGLAVFIVGDIRKKARYDGREDENERPRLLSMQSDIIQFFNNMGCDLFGHYIWKKTTAKQGIKRNIIYGASGAGELSNYMFPPYLYSDLLIEHVIVFRKPGPKRISSPLAQRDLRFEALNREEEANLWADQVWEINPVHNSNHPAVFPLELAYRIIKMFSMKNDTILDPFCGIGTTLEAALHLHRNAIGYEINVDYINEFSKRINIPIKNKGYIYSAEIGYETLNAK